MRTLVLSLCLLLCTPSTLQEDKAPLPWLTVSENKRFLQQENGKPFFWLGDTGWLLFAKLNRAEAKKYLDDRAAKGFNVIQAMVLHQLSQTDVYGDSALTAGNIALPRVTPGNSRKTPGAYDYWDHLDYIVKLAAERGMYMALVPVWGSNVKQGNVSREQADAYAIWLARRYGKHSNVIWLLGGDIRGSDSTEIWNIMGRRIREQAPHQLISFHPFGRTQSSTWFHAADWLDFNMFQSGHRRYDQDDSRLAYGQDNWKYVRDDYAHTPVKPTLDGEPSYESIPQGLHDPSQPYWNENDVRRYAYWSVFAGACGFTYGHNAVMQLHKPGDQAPAYGVREYWTDALQAPGAAQMKYLKHLILSKPYFERVPDQSLIAGGQGERYDYQVATRGKNYAFIYTCNGRDIQTALGKIGGPAVKASWFNPRTGKTTSIGTYANSGARTFDPPGDVREGNDWVLVLEAAH